MEVAGSRGHTGLELYYEFRQTQRGHGIFRDCRRDELYDAKKWRGARVLFDGTEEGRSED